MQNRWKNRDQTFAWPWVWRYQFEIQLYASRVWLYGSGFSRSDNLHWQKGKGHVGCLWKIKEELCTWEMMVVDNRWGENVGDDILGRISEQDLRFKLSLWQSHMDTVGGNNTIMTAKRHVDWGNKTPNIDERKLRKQTLNKRNRENQHTDKQKHHEEKKRHCTLITLLGRNPNRAAQELSLQNLVKENFILPSLCPRVIFPISYFLLSPSLSSTLQIFPFLWH